MEPLGQPIGSEQQAGADESGPPPSPGQAWWKRPRTLLIATGAGLLGGGVALTFGVAGAQTTPSPSTTIPSSAAPAVPGPRGPGGPGGPGGPKVGPAVKGIPGGVGFGGGIHGEQTVPDGKGGWQQIDNQTGKVESVSSSSITVKSADGFSRTYSVDANTTVDAGRDGIGTVKATDEVSVVAKDNGSSTPPSAIRIDDRTVEQAIQQHWRPGPTTSTTR